MNEMKSLHQLMIEKGADCEVEEINAEHLVGMVNGTPLVIRAVLDRTAVVHPLNDDSPVVRRLAALHEVFVWPQDIKWKLRLNPYDPSGSRLDAALAQWRARRNVQRGN